MSQVEEQVSPGLLLARPYGEVLQRPEHPHRVDALDIGQRIEQRPENGSHALVEDGPATAAGAPIIPGREVVRGFSLPDGGVRWQRSGELFDPGSGLAEENGIVYGTAGASAAGTAAASVLEPVFLTALQAATGRSVTLPLPAANIDADVVAAADGLVLVELSGSMAAFRPVPGPGNS